MASGGRTLALPIIPIRDVVVFPHTMFPFIIGRQSSIKAMDYALLHGRHLFLATQKDPTIDDPKPDDIYGFGTITVIVQNLRLPEGNIKVLVEGLRRGRIRDVRTEGGFYTAFIEPVEEETTGALDENDLRRRIQETFEEYVKVNPSFNIENILRVVKSADLSKITDNIANSLSAGVKEKQQLLEISDPEKRMVKIFEIIGFEVEKVKIDKTIQNRVREQMEKSQREYYLHEKIKAIHKELGEEDHESEVKALRERVEKSRMPKDPREKTLKEIRRLETMSPSSAEASVSRNYVDWLLSLPWRKKSKEIQDIQAAEAVLDEDHYGLTKVKERILEFLAVRQMSQKSHGSILCFVGPPGVGKTSLGKSIARATGRKFVRLSLGGVRDEAEIRGHRRTYIGAFPGQIIQMMRKAGTLNPVFLLDEVDKMSMDFRGDPSAALLEVLDPEQNSHFLDHYMDAEFSLSQVMFIATANVLHNIPRPLHDRMETLELTGYTEMEKMEIAKRFLVRKQMEAAGLKPEQIAFDDGAVLGIIRHYTRESGVRNLEREIGKVCRKTVRTILKKGREHVESISGGNISRFLGPVKFLATKSDRKDEVGMAIGMAWTETGGEILFTETGRMPGSNKLTLTGKLGEVMQESAQAAMSYVRSRLERFHIDPEMVKNSDIHLHLPEGAISKDGPSAGITMAVSILSALTGLPARGDVAMTGEITLRGKVLPIGGVKEKVLAAHRAGIRHVILPEENRKDLEDIPGEIREEVEFHFVETMDDVLAVAMVAMPQLARPPEVPLKPQREEETSKGRVAN